MGEYLVLGDVPGPWGVPGPEGMYLFQGGVPGPGVVYLCTWSWECTWSWGVVPGPGLGGLYLVLVSVPVSLVPGGVPGLGGLYLVPGVYLVRYSPR